MLFPGNQQDTKQKGQDHLLTLPAMLGETPFFYALSLLLMPIRPKSPGANSRRAGGTGTLDTAALVALKRGLPERSTDKPPVKAVDAMV